MPPANLLPHLDLSLRALCLFCPSDHSHCRDSEAIDTPSPKACSSRRRKWAASECPICALGDWTRSHAPSSRAPEFPAAVKEWEAEWRQASIAR